MTWRTCKSFHKKLSFLTASTTAPFRWDRCCCSSRTGRSSQDDELHFQFEEANVLEVLWFRIPTPDESSSLETGKPCRLWSLPSWGMFLLFWILRRSLNSSTCRNQNTQIFFIYCWCVYLPTIVSLFTMYPPDEICGQMSHNVEAVNVPPHLKGIRHTEPWTS